MTDPVLEGQLFTGAGKKQGHRRRAEPDWAEVHRELKPKHVTLQILWDEYIEQNPDGYRIFLFVGYDDEKPQIHGRDTRADDPLLAVAEGSEVQGR